MNTSERAQVRQTLLAQGFDRTSFTNDISGVGDYTETWAHPDGTVMEIKWSARTQREDANQWTDALDKALDRAEPRRLRPDDSSGSIDAATLDKVAREVAAIAAPDGARYYRGAPEAFAPYLNREITVTVHHTDGHETLTGYPYDSWRFPHTAVGLRVHFAKNNVAAGGDYIVLPDDTRWTLTPTDGGKGYEHIPQAIAPPAEPVVDAPGMYEETDMGIDLPASDEEDTIPSGFTGNQVNPEWLRFALDQHTIITARDETGKATSLAGYPVEAYRWGAAVAVRVTAELGGAENGDLIVLPDHVAWEVVPTDHPEQALFHYAPEATL